MLGIRLPQPEACSNAMYTLMMSCWDLTPSFRPAFATLQETLLQALAQQATAPSVHTAMMNNFMIDNMPVGSIKKNPPHRSLLLEEFHFFIREYLLS